MSWWRRQPARPPNVSVPDEVVEAHQEAKVAKARALQQRRRLAVMGARLVELHEKNGFGESLERVYKGEA